MSLYFFQDWARTWGAGLGGRQWMKSHRGFGHPTRFWQEKTQSQSCNPFLWTIRIVRANFMIILFCWYPTLIRKISNCVQNRVSKKGVSKIFVVIFYQSGMENLFKNDEMLNAFLTVSWLQNCRWDFIRKCWLHAVKRRFGSETTQNLFQFDHRKARKGQNLLVRGLLEVTKGLLSFSFPQLMKLLTK